VTPGLTLLPAVDVAGGRAAQVVGDGTTDPLAVAAGWVDQGAEWVHLVDLDLAFGRGANTDLLAGVIERLPVPVQLSGGIGDDATLAAALATGAARVNLSSLALRDPGWVTDVVRAHPDRVAVGVDVAGAEVVARGSAVRIGPLEEVLAGLAGAGCRTYVVADASRDGRLHGADDALFLRVAEAVDGQVVASGGVASLEDLRRLRALVPAGVTGLVLGSALYHGAFTLAEALEVANGGDLR
jgi:phosphoribosylformimino-5-aminoimidazole carboxamide ribonucleotide (ProFAR) isomerase